jgi:hypothetical protein
VSRQTRPFGKYQIMHHSNESPTIPVLSPQYPNERQCIAQNTRMEHQERCNRRLNRRDATEMDSDHILTRILIKCTEAPVNMTWMLAKIAAT